MKLRVAVFTSAVLVWVCLVAAAIAQDDTKQPSGDQPTKTHPVEPSASKVNHEGGKDDIDAIGNRNVGCSKGLGNWYSLEKQIAMGKQWSQEAETQMKLINDPVVTEYVNRLGQNLVRNSDSAVPFTIKVVDTDDINAFALPGGFFYVQSGLILAADEEAELAGVMAHEIAHVAACHIARQLSKQQLVGFATLVPAILLGGPIGYGAYEAGGLAGGLGIMKFNRNIEADADYLGVQYMYKAGYDPQAYVTFFEKIQAMEKKKPGTISKAFASHPQTPDRIEATQKEIGSILPAKAEYIVSTSEFDEVKARLAALENRHKLSDEKDGKKPTLRRTSSTDKNGSDDKAGNDKDDGRPTLKRRPDDN